MSRTTNKDYDAILKFRDDMILNVLGKDRTSAHHSVMEFKNLKKIILEERSLDPETTKNIKEELKDNYSLMGNLEVIHDILFSESGESKSTKDKLTEENIFKYKQSMLNLGLATENESEFICKEDTPLYDEALVSAISLHKSIARLYNIREMTEDIKKTISDNLYKIVTQSKKRQEETVEQGLKTERYAGLVGEYGPRIIRETLVNAGVPIKRSLKTRSKELFSHSKTLRNVAQKLIVDAGIKIPELTAHTINYARKKRTSKSRI